MKRLFIAAAVLALAVARPELYKEQEDFQFSRSSSDDGTKAGFYGAQRGNMGGNYERAHNMDSLAQNQMSGLVRQVEGELGDGAKMKAGSVYTAANSRGTYGSGHFDLSNLAGRNFQEGTYYDNSHSQSSSSLSQSSSAHNSAAYSSSHALSNSGAGYGGYQRVHGAQVQTDDLQSLDNTQASNLYDYGRQTSHSSGYQSRAGYKEHSEYDRSNLNSHAGYGSNVHTRLISATPVRIVLTPGSRIAIPVAAQTYSSSHGLSTYDQNAVNSEAETLSANNQGSVSRPENAKHYESSYRYHKKWEKHDTIPATIPIAPTTENNIPKNSELYEDSEAYRLANQYDSRGANAQTAHLNTASGRYNGVKSTSSQSGYQSNYNTQQSGESSNSNSNAYTQVGYNTRNNGASSDSSNAYNTASRYHGTSSAANLHSQAGYNSGVHADLNSQVEDLNTKPKSYQSSYSYHKSWERQGDPYVIKPASNGHYDTQTSQRLTASNQNQRYATYHAGSHYDQDQVDCDCDENGHIRVARSYNTDTQDMEQQSVNDFEGQEAGQQVQNNWQSLTDFEPRSDDQQSQNKWDNLEEFGQQSQSNFEQSYVGQQSQNLQDLEQQSQSNYDQQSVGQQTESKWDNLQDFGQQSQSNFEQQNVGQESQSQWEKIEDLEQQSAKNWGQAEDLGQQSGDHNTWDKLEDINQQQSNTNDNLETLGQQAQNFLEGHNQDIDTQVEITTQNSDPRPQYEHQFDVNKTDSQTGNDNVEQVHKIESPWDKFDLIDSNTTKVTTDQNHKTESNDFYWHQISSHVGMDQQINNFEQESDQIPKYDIKPTLEQFHDNLSQNDGAITIDNNYYSNGFANPSVYNQPIHIPRITYHASTDNFGVQSWNSHNSNSFTSVNWQQHETNSESHSQEPNFNSNIQDSPLLSLWGKFDNIEKQSLSPSQQHARQEETYHTENNITSINSNDKILTEYQPSSSQSNTEKAKDVQTEHSAILIPVIRSSASEEIKANSNEMHEKPQDTGRGDIDSEDLYGNTEVINKLYKNHDSVLQQNNNNDQKFSKPELTVLSLGMQKEQNENNRTLVSSSHDATDMLQNTNHFADSQKQTSYEHNNTETRHYQENRMYNELSKQHGDLSQQYVNNYEHVVHEHDKILDQNQYLQHLPNFNQENVNLEQQNVNNFQIDAFPEFGQQNENLEQQHFNNFEQQNVQDSEQQNLQGPNWDNFEQGFDHKIYPEEQQNTNQFEIKNEDQQDLSNIHNFEQSNTNFDQQDNQFSQASIRNIGLTNENINTFEEETVPDFGQQHESLQQSTLQSFNHNHDLDMQNENMEQQNLHNSGQQNKNIDSEQIDKLLEKPDSQTTTTLQSQAPLDIIEEPIKEKVYNNLHSNSTNSSETEVLVELVTDKPGFWKSVGNKFSSAKNTVVSWFRSK